MKPGNAILQNRVSEVDHDREERFRALVEASGQIVWVTDASGAAIEDSPSWRAFTGQTFEQWRGWGRLDALHPEDRTRVREIWRQALATKTPISTEYRVRHISGEWRWTAVRAVPMFDATGAVAGWVGSNGDLTERRRAEDTLRESEERNRCLAEITSDFAVTCRVTAEDKIVLESVTEGFAKATGYTLEELAAPDGWQVLVYPADLPAVAQGVTRLLAGHAVDQEIRICTKQGAIRWVRYFSRPVLDPALGRVTRIYCGVQDISERKQAEEALRASEQRYHTIFQTAGVSIWEEDFSEVKRSLDLLRAQGVRDFRSYFAEHPDFVERAIGMVKIIDVNDATLRLYGAQDKRELLESLHKIFLPETLPVFVEELVVLAEGRTFLQAETVVRTLQGERMPILFTIVFPPSNEKMDSVLVSVMDLTARKRADEERQKFVSLADSSLEFIGMCDRDFQPFYVNPAGMRLVGLDSFEAAYRVKVQDYFFPEDQRFITEEFFPRVLREGQGEIEIRFRHFQTGEPIWMLYNVFNLRDASGVTIGWATVSRNIHDRKRAEEKLHASEDRLRMAQQAANIGTFEWNIQTGVNIWTPELERMYGLKPGEFGRTQPAWEQLVHPEDRAEAVGMVQQAFKTGLPVEGEWRVVWPDGSVHWITGRFQVLKDADGKPMRLVGVNLDITERKRAEEEIRKLNASLEERVRERTVELARSNADLEQFAYAASHDLKEPLRAISSYLDLLVDRYRDGLDQRARQWIEYAVEGSNRMTRLIQDLLEYSRLGRRHKRVQPTDCGVIFDVALANLLQVIHETGAAVTRGALPRLAVDGEQLTRVFQNLIGNALKFRSHQRPEVHVTAEPRAGEWLFRVQDNGIGIDPQFAKRIFIIFQRLHTESEYPGTGIGLAMCKRIVEQHGGRIWVESKPGCGATFLFTIPHAHAEDPIDGPRQTETTR